MDNEVESMNRGTDHHLLRQPPPIPPRITSHPQLNHTRNFPVVLPLPSNLPTTSITVHPQTGRRNVTRSNSTSCASPATTQVTDQSFWKRVTPESPGSAVMKQHTAFGRTNSAQNHSKISGGQPM